MKLTNKKILITGGSGFIGTNLIIELLKHTKKIIFFGVGSAIALTIHALFLGIKLDYSLYKLFRRY